MKSTFQIIQKMNHPIFKFGMMVTLISTFLGLSTLNAQQLSALSGSFVDIGAGSRSAALGNAFTGLADDPTALFTNPAGMTGFTTPSVLAMSTNQLGLVTSNYFSAIYPLGNAKDMSVGIGAISSGDNLLRETTFQAAYALKVLDGLSVGAALKARFTSFGNNTLNTSDYDGLFDPGEISTGILNQVNGSGNGFAFDLGILFQPNDQIRFGLSLRDPVAPFNWDSATNNPDASSKGAYNEKLPMALHIGGSYKLNKNVLVTTEYQPSLEAEQDPALRIGIETIIREIVALRGGTEQWANNEDDEKYMLGFGLIAPEMNGFILQLDYTYVIDQLANSHRVGLILNFPNLR